MSMHPGIEHPDRRRARVVAASEVSAPSILDSVRRAPLSAILFVAAYFMILSVTLFPGIMAP